MNKIKEAIKTNYGKLIYVIELEQSSNNKIQLYIDRNNKIYFDSNSYSFNNYNTFDINEEAHRVSKEIFLTYLQAYVKTKLLELKQLELVLDELGLKDVIRKTIVDNSSMLLETKDEIIKESIEITNELINETVRPIARKNKKKESDK